MSCLQNHNNRYWLPKRVPRELQETIGHKEIIISLRTADAQRAEALYVREQAKVLARLKRRGRHSARNLRTRLSASLKEGVTVKTVINSLTFDGTENDPVKLATQVALLAFMAAGPKARLRFPRKRKGGIEHAQKLGRMTGRKPSFSKGQISRLRRSPRM